MTTTVIQRLENGVLALAILAAFIATGAGWWWPLVAFLAFDLSTLGYLRGPRVGAIVYNIVHSYIGPALLLAIGLALGAFGIVVPALPFAGGLWGFHVAADRALGYGLKLDRGFEHTHLGPIGKARRGGAATP